MLPCNLRASAVKCLSPKVFRHLRQNTFPSWMPRFRVLSPAFMLSAPRQNWKLYEERCRDEHVRWLQELTPAESLAIYESLYRWAAMHADRSLRAEMLDERRWQEKLALR